jgi:hypothetical protein
MIKFGIIKSLLDMFHVNSYKTYFKMSSRKVSDTDNSENGVSNGTILHDESHAESLIHAEEKKTSKTQDEYALGQLLNELAPNVLPIDESVVMEPIPDDVLDRLFERNIKFSDKVNLIKNYLRQPLRTALVAEMPTATTDVVKHDSLVKGAIELLYVMRCIVAVFPEFADDIITLCHKTFSGDKRNVQQENIQATVDYLKTLRGSSAPVSAVAAAALKVFYTVDGMAFDDFAVTLSALEWEQITANMNLCRIEFAEEIRQKSTADYHMKTSKETKLLDKSDLDKRINDARIPLVKIMKLTLEDLHRKTQLYITAQLELRDASKKIRYDRKTLLARVKSAILQEFRRNPDIDILKYAKSTAIVI